MWHEKQPVFSVHFDPKQKNRFATSGGDSHVRIWELSENGPEFRSTLSRHVQAVNCVRWSPTSNQLASGGDDGIVFVWEPTEQKTMEDEDSKEFWRVSLVLRGATSEIYDLCWSPDGQQIASACVDNTVRIFHVKDQKCIQVLSEHTHYVQGICWDPLGQFIASLSSDRAMHVYKHSGDKKPQGFKIQARHSKITRDNESQRLYSDENLATFFRRLAFSPDGQILVSPSGILDNHLTCHIYTRGNLLGAPVAHLPGHQKSPIAVAFNPLKYPLLPGDNVFQLPHRYFYCVANQEAAVIYDTQHEHPIAFVGHVHYTTLTDVSWNCDGRSLMISSTDGFCTFVDFQDDLGEPIPGQTLKQIDYTPQSVSQTVHVLTVKKTPKAVQ
ncbi:WD40-repeat-containing domain protein [Gorgonomyces haynaldii]|nr:WD40-repeat-containing domain protein [Gorgonomyces haynaldii]